MTFEKHKFPFKWFNAIINALKKENDAHLLPFEISSQIGSCVSDASESTRMLRYLLHFGKLDKNQYEKWYLLFSDSPNNFPEIDFRIKYIQNLVEILKIIQNANHPVHIDVLSESVNFGREYILQALEFYASISQNGKISSGGKGYRRSWRIKDWPLK